MRSPAGVSVTAKATECEAQDGRAAEGDRQSEERAARAEGVERGRRRGGGERSDVQPRSRPNGATVAAVASA